MSAACVCAGHFHPVRFQLGIEVAALGQHARDGRLAAFIDRVMKDFAGQGMEGGDSRRYRRIVLAPGASMANLSSRTFTGSPRSMARWTVTLLADARDFRRDLRVVVAVRLEPLQDFSRRLRQQIGQSRLADIAAQLRRQPIDRQMRANVRRQFAVDSAQLDRLQFQRNRVPGKCRREQRKQQAERGRDEASAKCKRASVNAGTALRRRRTGLRRWTIARPRRPRRNDRPAAASRARRLPRTAGSSAMTITPSKNASTGGAQSRQPPEHADVVARGQQRHRYRAIAAVDGIGQGVFGRLGQQCAIDLGGNDALDLAQDIADALVGGGERGGFGQLGEFGDGAAGDGRSRAGN